MIKLEKEQVLDYLYKSGLLFEINRMVMHPLGMSLSLVVEDDDTVSGLGPIYGTDDPEGTVMPPELFVEGMLKMEKLRSENDPRSLIRVEKYGTNVQICSAIEEDQIVWLKEVFENFEIDFLERGGQYMAIEKPDSEHIRWHGTFSKSLKQLVERTQRDKWKNPIFVFIPQMEFFPYLVSEDEL